MEFQIFSTLQVKSCKIASISFTSRDKDWAVYFLLNSSIKNQFLYNIIPVNHAILPVFNILPARANHLTVITSWIFILIINAKFFFHSSNEQQEMEFQICSTLKMISCKIGSLLFELYLTIINAKPVLFIFQMWNRK